MNSFSLVINLMILEFYKMAHESKKPLFSAICIDKAYFTFNFPSAISVVINQIYK